ncbi:MAG: hypothetical protein V2I33_18145 [Kangiellaceae bacterium]|nr:hypothetical protein [Kangiellaceae bacterium]
MARSRAEIQKAYRQRNRDSLKAKERERSRLRRGNRDEMKIAHERAQNTARKRLERAIKVVESSNEMGFASSRAERRALNKTKAALPRVPSKRDAVLRRLSEEFNVSYAGPKKRETMTLPSRRDLILGAW